MYIWNMRGTMKNKTTHIVALFGVFAMLTGFSLAGTDFSPTVIASQQGEDTLSELAFHFPDQTGEQAILNKTDDFDFVFDRFTNHRFLAPFGIPGSAIASCFSRLQSHFAENPFDNKNTIQIKLRI